MKRVFLAFLLLIGLTAPTISSANAVFGLGACEKVSKKILGFEKKITDVFTKGMGYNYEQVVFKKKETVWEPTSETLRMVEKVIANDPVPQIWKLATNNPKCFTNTQNMQIVKMKEYTIKTYLYYPVTHRKYKNTGECKILMESNERKYDRNWEPTAKTTSIDSKCAITDVTTINFIQQYQSIYKY